jgi:hypothetical protein
MNVRKCGLLVVSETRLEVETLVSSVARTMLIYDEVPPTMIGSRFTASIRSKLTTLRHTMFVILMYEYGAIVVPTNHVRWETTSAPVSVQNTSDVSKCNIWAACQTKKTQTSPLQLKCM